MTCGAASRPMWPAQDSRPSGSIIDRSGGAPSATLDDAVTRRHRPGSPPDARRWPTARPGGAAGASVAEPRHAQRQLVAALGAGQRVDLVHHHACQAGEHAAAHRAATAAPRGFPAWSAGCAAALARCRARRLAGVSPVRVSMRDRQAHLLDRARQVARDVGGQRLQRADIERVQAGPRRFAPDRPGVGRNPASVLPPPVGAISSTLSPARAASSMASWCGRGVQPCAANQRQSVPVMFLACGGL